VFESKLRLSTDAQPGDFQPGGLNLTLNRELNRAIFFFDRAIPTWWSQPGGLNLVVNLVVLTEQKKREMPRGPTWWSQPSKNINVRQPVNPNPNKYTHITGQTRNNQ
jgi:hypothetical protein